MFIRIYEYFSEERHNTHTQKQKNARCFNLFRRDKLKTSVTFFIKASLVFL